MKEMAKVVITEFMDEAGVAREAACCDALIDPCHRRQCAVGG